jgi:hypothetical protein
MRTFNHVRRSLLQVLLLMLLAFVSSAALSIAVILKADHEDYRNNLAKAIQLEIDAKAGRPKPPETPKPEPNKTESNNPLVEPNSESNKQSNESNSVRL